ncbi:hypothetical protein Tco_0587291, partial [Tanacetum coccineum]
MVRWCGCGDGGCDCYDDDDIDGGDVVILVSVVGAVEVRM